MIKSKSFQKNIFFSVGAIFVLFALSFSIYQYKREKEYKIDILHARLQMYNYEMMHTLGQQELLDKESFMSYVAKHHYEGLRVSVIDSTGRVLMDSREPNVNLLDNHL
ncbi:MAG: two-component sensor histidine kinase, partial [Bacteroidaceae bacterium]|nr:two-component sensor histidine kinase [Bacteroidaceae bacterium]